MDSLIVLSKKKNSSFYNNILTENDYKSMFNPRTDDLPYHLKEGLEKKIVKSRSFIYPNLECDLELDSKIHIFYRDSQNKDRNEILSGNRGCISHLIISFQIPNSSEGPELYRFSSS